jgi:hypothetical protein
MKTKYIFLALCLFFTSMGFAQNKIFDKFADMDDVTSIYISKAMFKMMPDAAKTGMKVNTTNLKGKIESLQLVSTEKPDKITQLKKDFSNYVTAQYQELMRVKDGKSRVNIYANMDGEEKIKEFFMLVEDDKSYMAILLTGNFTLKDIQDIADQNGKE